MQNYSSAGAAQAVTALRKFPFEVKRPKKEEIPLIAGKACNGFHKHKPATDRKPSKAPHVPQAKSKAAKKTPAPDKDWHGK